MKLIDYCSEHIWQRVLGELALHYYDPDGVDQGWSKVSRVIDVEYLEEIYGSVCKRQNCQYFSKSTDPVTSYCSKHCDIPCPYATSRMKELNNQLVLLVNTQVEEI